MAGNLRIDGDRLLRRLDALAEVGAIDGGGCCRLALSDADKTGRDLVAGWMRELGLAVTVDAIGNLIGLRAGRAGGPPVMTGSHIDTVRTGGRYDGNYGVLAGLEVVERLNEAGIVTERPLAVAVFTNEEGARFQPDMLGSLVFAGGMALEEALAVQDSQGLSVGGELARIGYAGEPRPGLPVAAFVELHIEQGPVLEAEGVEIGAVEGVQGISWTELVIEGVSNHAGTTPMRMRRDAGLAAAEIAVFARRLAGELGGEQVATVGVIELSPNLINVIANRARLTVDLRNTDEARLQEAERRLRVFLDELAAREGVAIAARPLARFEPVAFESAMVERIARIARAQGRSVKRMPSGAGHDAQMLARICPTAMIFVPSEGGLSHNVRERTAPEQLVAGADVLLQALIELADGRTA